ncbi:MAG: cupin domain-containing protein [Armatimonadota bacterium]
MRRVILLLAVALGAGLVSAQPASTPGPVVRAGADQRFAASGSLPPGAEYHLMWEDPVSKGVQALVRVPKGYFIPPHSHTRNETMLVIKGKLTLDFGATRSTLKAGDYALLPAGTAFSLKAEGWGQTEFFIAFDGPYDSKPAELK